MNGIARVERRRGTVWKIRYRAPVEPNSMVVRQITETLVHCASRRQAEGVLAMRKAQVFEQTYRPRTTERPPTLTQYAKETFLPSKVGKPIHADYERSLRLHLLKHLGSMLLRDVELQHLHAYRASRLSEAAAPKTIKNELDCLSTLYVMAVADGKAERDPTAAIDHGKIDNRRERLLNPQELERLLVELSTQRGWLRALFVVLYYTGLRVSDACALSWERVSFEANYLAQKQKKTGEWVYPPMHPALAQELRRWKSESIPSPWVFPQARAPSNHISRFAVAEPWAKLLKNAGVENLTRHDMRKLLVTTLKARGASTGDVMNISGHGTAAMVDHYNLGPDMAALAGATKAMALLPSLNLASDRHISTIVEAQSKDEKPNVITPNTDD